MSEQDPTQGYVPILSRLRPADGAVKSKRRKGRGPGSGLGKTAGKGQKGQKARHPGAFSKLAFEGGQLPLQRRLPKVGFWNPFTRHLATVNLSDLAVFEKGAVVDAGALREKRLVRGRFDGIKVLGDGDLAHPVTIRAHGFSKSALEKIAKVGGTAEVIALAPRAE